MPLTAAPTSGTPRENAVPLLLDLYGARLYRLATRICGSAGEAEDLVQDVFLMAWRKWPQFRGDSKASTWLYRIAGRTCQRRHRRRAGQPRRILSIESLADASHHAFRPAAHDRRPEAETAERRDEVAALQAAIARLPERFRLPLLLKDVLELPVADVARALDVKAGTVKTRVHRARLALRQILVSHAGRTAATAVSEYDRRTCLDLLKVKLDSLDRGIRSIAPSIVCARCRQVFAELDRTQELCGALGQGRLPAEARRRILAVLRSQEGASSRSRRRART